MRERSLTMAWGKLECLRVMYGEVRLSSLLPPPLLPFPNLFLLSSTIFTVSSIEINQLVDTLSAIMDSVITTLNTSKQLITDHPYFPLEVEIASYLANEWSVPTLLGIFAALCATVVFGTKAIVSRVHPNLPSTERAAIWWLVLCMSYLSRLNWGS